MTTAARTSDPAMAPPPSAPPAAPPPARRARAFALLQHQGALIALVIASIFGFQRYGTFLTPENLLNVLRQNSMVGLVALGMTFVILTGGIDLSVGALLAVAGAIAAAMSPHGSAVALLAGVGAAGVLGL